MTEEINNINTDLKELFVNSQIDETIECLNGLPDEVINEITLYNYEIIKKYYDSKKYNLIIQYMKFVAYSCFLCEYSSKHQIITSSEYEGMSFIFSNIYDLIKRKE